MECDFYGLATKNDLKREDEKKRKKVPFVFPLVWDHQHRSVDRVLGHAILENKD